jgi:hypothetical protein
MVSKIEDDKTGGIPLTRLSAAVKVSYDKHRRWREEGLLGDRDPAQATDATHLAVLDRMICTAGPKRAKRAWRTVRPLLEKQGANARPAGWVVVDGDLERDSIAFLPSELARCFREQGRFWVIPLTAVIEKARRDFDEHARVGDE